MKKIIIKNLCPDNIYENDYEKFDRDTENNRNSKPRPYDYFNPKGYIMLYQEDYPYFILEINDIIDIQIKIINKDDIHSIQIHQGDLNSLGNRYSQGKYTTPYYVLIGYWKKGQF